MASIIAEEGCISYFNNCEPTNTDLGPLYPLISSLFYKHTISPVKNLVFFQTFIHIICCFFFTFYLKRNYRIKTYHALILLAFSLLNPLSIGWQRYILPDTFSLDISLIVVLLIDFYRIRFCI